MERGKHPVNPDDGNRNNQSGSKKNRTSISKNSPTFKTSIKASANKNQVPTTQIIQLTTAAAVKAAATALLTNKVVRKISVRRANGEIFNFLVERCVIEPGSALCSIAGPREAVTAIGTALEICVRVAWSSAKIQPEPDVRVSQTEDVVQVETAVINLATPIHSGQHTAVPVSFYYVIPSGVNLAGFDLNELPRQMLLDAVEEVLTTVAPERLQAGVRVMVALVGRTSGNDAQIIFNAVLPEPVQTVVDVAVEKPVPDLSLCQNGELVVTLDEISSANAYMLFDYCAECFYELSSSNFSLAEALLAINASSEIHAVSVCGGISSMLALAFGEINHVHAPFNPSLLITLAQRRELDSGTIQSLREVNSASALLLLISRKHLGWLLDEICRLGCLEMRKRLKRPVYLDIVLLGNSGAVLGRSSVESGNFKI